MSFVISDGGATGFTEAVQEVRSSTRQIVKRDTGRFFPEYIFKIYNAMLKRHMEFG